MPMKLNVGASQKVSDHHFGSRGASVNLEIELESGLATDPVKLRERIRQLFGLVRQSVTEELDTARNGQSPSLQERPSDSRKQAIARFATAAQVKALYAITKQQGIDLREVLQERYAVTRPTELSLKQASELIDALKAANAPVRSAADDSRALEYLPVNET